MPKTRKAHHITLPQYAATFHGLEKWHVAMFEKLGWMVLAKAKGMDYKVTAYKKSVEHLVKSIEHVMGEYHDPDRIHDLKVLHMNVLCLHGFIMKNL